MLNVTSGKPESRIEMHGVIELARSHREGRVKYAEWNTSASEQGVRDDGRAEGRQAGRGT